MSATANDCISANTREPLANNYSPSIENKLVTGGKISHHC